MRACFVKYALSPESILIPLKLILPLNSSATLIAVGIPDFKVSKVSTKNTQSECVSAYALGHRNHCRKPNHSMGMRPARRQSEQFRCSDITRSVSRR